MRTTRYDVVKEVADAIFLPFRSETSAASLPSLSANGVPVTDSRGEGEVSAPEPEPESTAPELLKEGGRQEELPPAPCPESQTVPEAAADQPAPEPKQDPVQAVPSSAPPSAPLSSRDRPVEAVQPDKRCC